MTNKLRPDANEIAFDLVQRATGQKPKAKALKKRKRVHPPKPKRRKN